MAPGGGVVLMAEARKLSDDELFHYYTGKFPTGYRPPTQPQGTEWERNLGLLNPEERRKAVSRRFGLSPPPKEPTFRERAYGRVYDEEGVPTRADSVELGIAPKVSIKEYFPEPEDKFKRMTIMDAIKAYEDLPDTTRRQIGLEKHMGEDVMGRKTAETERKEARTEAEAVVTREQEETKKKLQDIKTDIGKTLQAMSGMLGKDSIPILTVEQADALVTSGEIDTNDPIIKTLYGHLSDLQDEAFNIRQKTKRGKGIKKLNTEFPPTQYRGRKVKDTDTGTTYWSDGVKWHEVE